MRQAIEERRSATGKEDTEYKFNRNFEGADMNCDGLSLEQFYEFEVRFVMDMTEEQKEMSDPEETYSEERLKVFYEICNKIQPNEEKVQMEDLEAAFIYCCEYML